MGVAWFFGGGRGEDGALQGGGRGREQRHTQAIEKKAPPQREE